MIFILCSVVSIHITRYSIFKYVKIICKKHFAKRLMGLLCVFMDAMTRNFDLICFNKGDKFEK